MRRMLALVATAFVVVALGAPAYADSARSPSDRGVSAMRDRNGGDHRDGGRRGDFRHGDNRRGDDHRGDHRDYRRDGYYRHNYGYYDDYYYDGYYYNRGPTRARCDWAYNNDRPFFDRYCRGYYGYGSYGGY